jgi:anti-sigma B factor antagonist
VVRNFDIASHAHPDGPHTWTIVVSGELDAAATSALASTFEQLRRQRAAVVTLDLAAVEFIDSSGVGGLVAASDRMTVDGGRLDLGAMSFPVRRTLRTAGLLDRFRAYPSA